MTRATLATSITNRPSATTVALNFYHKTSVVVFECETMLHINGGPINAITMDSDATFVACVEPFC